MREIEVGDYVLKEGITTSLNVSWPLEVTSVTNTMVVTKDTKYGSPIRMKKKSVRGVFKTLEAATVASDKITEEFEKTHNALLAINKAHVLTVNGILKSATETENE